MAEPEFSDEVLKALDSYAVPPVPVGFGERLMARIASGDTGAVESAEAPPLPSRRRTTSPWRRSSRIIGSVAIFSLATATAAAAGIFGEQLYVPVISEALAEAKIVEAPKPVGETQTADDCGKQFDPRTRECCAATVNRQCPPSSTASPSCAKTLTSPNCLHGSG